jgi:hypothetical protein
MAYTRDLATIPDEIRDNLRRNMLETRANASEFLYSIVDQEADPQLVSDYNDTVAGLDRFLAAVKDDTLTENDHSKYYALYDYRGHIASPYAALTSSELALLMEFVVDGQHFFLAHRSGGTSAAPKDMLLSTRPTLEFKVALASLCYNLRFVAWWLCTENNGEHVQTVIDFKLQRYPDGGMRDLGRKHHVQDLVANALIYNRGKDDETGGNLITEFREELVTKDFLTDMIGMMTKWRDYTPQLAVHARRLYDIDEAVPDEWVIRMIA